MVSVIIPCYNSENYISACLKSIMGQTYSKWEAICIDDGSTDKTNFILNQFALTDARIVIVKQRNRGVSAARNCGLSLARGEYICFVDSDDTVEPNFLSVMLQIVNEKIDLVICNFTRSMIPYNKDVLGYTEMSNTRCIKRIILDKRFNPQICCMLFRHKIIKENQLEFMVGCTRGEDREFIMKYLIYSYKVCYTKTPLYHYRVNNLSAMAAFTIKSLTSIDASQRTLDYYKKMKIPIRCIEFELPRTLWKFLILALLSGQEDLYQTISRRYDLKEQLHYLYSYPGILERVTVRLFVLSESLFKNLFSIIGIIVKKSKNEYNK